MTSTKARQAPSCEAGRGVLLAPPSELSCPSSFPSPASPRAWAWAREHESTRCLLFEVKVVLRLPLSTDRAKAPYQNSAIPPAADCPNDDHVSVTPCSSPPYTPRPRPHHITPASCPPPAPTCTTPFPTNHRSPVCIRLTRDILAPLHQPPSRPLSAPCLAPPPLHTTEA